MSIVIDNAPSGLLKQHMSFEELIEVIFQNPACYELLEDMFDRKRIEQEMKQGSSIHFDDYLNSL